jgi:hypothetical protein
MTACTQFLHDDDANSIVLRRRADGQIEAIAIEAMSIVATAADVTDTTALELIAHYLGNDDIEKTLPSNELPEPCPDTLTSTEVANA